MQPDSNKTPVDFVNYLAEQIDRRGLKPQIFLPKRGDLLVWHGNVLHGGSVVKDKSRTRKSYVTHYTSLGSYPPDHRFADAFENNRHTFINGGYCFEHPWVHDAHELPSWSTLGLTSP
jgi:hypothetical protein